MGERVKGEFQTTNNKLQINNKSQIPNDKRERENGRKGD